MKGSPDDLAKQLSLIIARLDSIEKLLTKYVEEQDQYGYIDELPPLLTSIEVEVLCQVSSVTLWKWGKKGILKSKKVRGRKYYKKSDVLKLLGLA